MGDILNTAEASVGQTDLHQCMMVDPKEVNKKIPETSLLLTSGRFQL